MTLTKDNLECSSRKRVLKGVILVIAMAIGLLLNVVLLWVAGRYGQPTFFIARIGGLAAAGLIPIIVLTILQLTRTPSISWYCIIIVFVFLQARSGFNALQIFMSGFERTVFTTANVSNWEGLLRQLSTSTGELPLKVTVDRLPSFVQSVYPERRPWCLSDGGTLNDGTVIVFWRDVRVCVGVSVGNPSNIVSSQIFNKQFSPKLFLVAFPET